MTNSTDGRFVCAECGCGDFELYMTDIHLKAVCKSCHEPVMQNDGNRPHFVAYIEEDVMEEPATDKQIAYIKYLMKDNARKLTRVLAGDIINTLLLDIEPEEGDT